MKVETECYQTMDKKVSAQKTAGIIYVPLSWEGKRVRVLLLEPAKEEE